MKPVNLTQLYNALWNVIFCMNVTFVYELNYMHCN